MEYGMDAHGNLVTIVGRLPILKIQRNEGRKKIFWDTHALPPSVLRAFILHLENVLESVRQQLADAPDDT
jgi:hypothetical protein